MLFLLFGSSGAGKTAALDGVRGLMPDLAVHDFDEVGVPPDADTAWRQRADEEWLQRVLGLQAEGRDVLLGGQVPFGELLAAPSAFKLDGLTACLLDCSDETRLERIHARGPGWIERVPGELQDHLHWAAWMRRHARDPAWRQDVIRASAVEDMRWERWSAWHRGDPRWRVKVINTSHAPVGEVVEQVTAWVAGERSLHLSARHPLGAAALRRLDGPPEPPSGDIPYSLSRCRLRSVVPNR